ncbi:hypothetical protein [Paenibacillus sp. PAMC21692]|uniref:hypothetical protein n=1 Tax=Paenibacillus sp. PAMC21692 TaxID=2762320 RepID=UPI00164EC632|nr:hypothetical protein [Paenibacillus sp. PAMC21692]QNK58268.1 hypothetical protein H7F31_04845 [Paenibacillus sp. PAMC21692]
MLQIPVTDEWRSIVYHRRPLSETDPNRRVVCIDRMTFAAEGAIEPLRITFDGVAARNLG